MVHLLKHCVTGRKVTGSIPDGVIGIFHWFNHSGRNIPLGSTQPLREMSTRNIYCGVMASTLPPSCADCLEIWDPQPPGTLWHVPAYTGIAKPYLLCIIVNVIYFNTGRIFQKLRIKSVRIVYLKNEIQ